MPARPLSTLAPALAAALPMLARLARALLAPTGLARRDGVGGGVVFRHYL